MKNMSTNRPLKNLFALICCVTPLLAVAQEDTAKENKESMLYLRYYVVNNQVPYLNVQTKNKLGKTFTPQGNVPVSIYLNKDADPASLVGKVTTNSKGVATIGIPANLANQWKENASPTFYARTDSTPDFNPTNLELIMTKSRLELDTVNDGESRSVKARLLKYENDTVVPLPEVDVKLAVKRLGGYLNIGDEETYTTDSIGDVQGVFTQKNLPGDSLGNIEIVALVDDNDAVGTLENHLKVPWGVPAKYHSKFEERTLFATGNKAPGWLLFLALGIIIGVWSVIIYLITNIIRIRKLGVR